VEWYDALIAHFRHSRNVRLWFVQNILFAQPSRLSEYLLESPSSEVSIFLFWEFLSNNHYIHNISREHFAILSLTVDGHREWVDINITNSLQHLLYFNSGIMLQMLVLRLQCTLHCCTRICVFWLINCECFDWLIERECIGS